MVERYEPELAGTREDYADMIVVDSGDYVLHSDYEALEARCSELEREISEERDEGMWRFWRDKARSSTAHAQRLTEALKILRDEMVEETSIDTEDWQLIITEALSLTPTTALAAVRDEVREECAVLIETTVLEYGTEGVRLVKQDEPLNDVRTKALAAAIRARKETGE